jgi:hypothetical protein
MEGMTVRDYAIQQGITIGTAYRRLWEGHVHATKFYGRWLIEPEEDVRAHSAAPEALRSDRAKNSRAAKVVSGGI